MTENLFSSHYSPFEINTQLFFLFVLKMAAGGHFGSPIWAILDDRNHFRSHFSPFQINTYLFCKMATSGHFGSPISPQNNRVLPLCVINGYAKYEVDR